MTFHGFYLIGVVIFTCLGQILQKQAVETAHSSSSLFTKLLSPWLIAAFTCLGIGMLFWLLALQYFPVSAAYPILSLNFVVITLAGQWLYGEKIDQYHWFGVLLIMLGVYLVGTGL